MVTNYRIAGNITVQKLNFVNCCLLELGFVISNVL